MREKRKRRRVVRDITFNGGGVRGFSAMKFHRQCPLVFLVKVG
jgi:hypothetical protein